MLHKPVKLHSGDTLFVPNDGRPSKCSFVESVRRLRQISCT